MNYNYLERAITATCLYTNVSKLVLVTTALASVLVY